MGGYYSIPPPPGTKHSQKDHRLCDSLQAEYERWKDIIGEDDPYAGPLTLGIHDVLWAHFLIADFFLAEGDGIGGIGPKDINLLHSALHRQCISFDGKEKWEDKFEVAATLLYGLIKNHPFHDANKRTAFLSVIYLLQKLGRCPQVSHKEFEDFTVKISEDAFSKKRRYKNLARKGDDPEIKYIAYYLKKNTRFIDKKHYSVNYIELQSILNDFGFDLINHKNNFIDVVKNARRRKYLGLSKKEVVEQHKLGQIVFPGWRREVNRNAVKYVRQLTNLTFENGYDSQTFYKGMDDMQSLLNYYQAQLVSLADR